MPTPAEEAQLEQTKMSFGEHLEELRRALFRSLFALIFGFLIGLMFGRQVVDYIQGPLRDSLKEFYLRQAKAEQLRYLQTQKDLGADLPDDLEKLAAQVVEQGLVPHDYYLSPHELRTAIAEHDPELAERLELAPDDAAGDAATDDQPPDEVAAIDPALLVNRDEMIRLRLYQPMEDDLRLRIVELNAQAPFVIYIKASLAVGLLIASPFIFYFIWDFVAAGLYRSERKYVYMYLPLSLGLFLSGAALAYYGAFQFVLNFLFWFFESMHIDPDMRLSEWITFVILLPVGFGLSFQLPLAMLLLERLGIFTIESYTSKWRISIVVISVLSMVFSPGGDPYSMLFMFVPLTGLYFLGIALCKYMPGGPLRRRKDDPAANAGS